MVEFRDEALQLNPAQRIYLRRDGACEAEFYLEHGEYLVGRSRSCDFIVNDDHVSRVHGRIFLSQGQWFFQDMRRHHPHFNETPQLLDGDNRVILDRGLELVTEDLVEQESTKFNRRIDVFELSAIIKRHRTTLRALTAFAIVGLLLLVSWSAVKEWNRPLSPTELLKFASPKILQFEVERSPEVIRDYKQVFNYTDEDFNESLGYCTGFMVAPEVVVTASHCLHGLDLVNIITSFHLKAHDGKTFQATHVLGVDIKRDSIFLKVPGITEYGYFQLADTFEIGQKVYTIGNVSGQGIAIRSGEIANVTPDENDPNVRFIRYSAAASPGNSGGPLVNDYGEVVGLVFARSTGENYNKATASQDLIAKSRDFGTLRKPVKQSIQIRDMLNLKGLYLLRTLGIPSPANWFQNSEYARELDQIQTELMLPQDLNSYANALVTGLNAAAMEQVDAVNKQMSLDGVAHETWNLQVHDTFPSIQPFRDGGAGNQDRFLYRNGTLIEKSMQMLTPLSGWSYRNTLKTWLSSGANVYQPESAIVNVFEGLKVRPSRESDNWVTLPKLRANEFWYIDDTGRRSLFGRSSLEVVGYGLTDNFTSNWAQARKMSLDMLEASLLGPEGAYVSSRSPYVRPKAQRNELVTKLPNKLSHVAVKDNLGREWMRHSVSMMEDHTAELYCLSLPAGQICVRHSILGGDGKELLKVQQDNFANYHLSEMIPKPRFWPIDASLRFATKEPQQGVGLSSMTVSANLARKQLTFKLADHSLSVAWPRDKIPEQLRVRPALMQAEGEPKWTVIGVEGLVKQSRFAYELCGFALAYQGMDGSALEDMALQKKTTIWKKGMTFGKRKGDVFGYCIPIRHDTTQPGEYQTDFDGLKAQSFYVTNAKL